MLRLNKHASVSQCRISRISDPVRRAVLSPAIIRHNSSTTPATIPDNADKTVEGASSFPDLMIPDVIMDSHTLRVIPPSRQSPHESRIITRNDAFYMFHEAQRMQAEEEGVDFDSEGDEDAQEFDPLKHMHLSRQEINRLYKYPLIRRTVVQQTGKGKIRRHAALVVVGNGDGLVGYGEGKDAEAPRSIEKAFTEAVRNMDYVERFEKRTIWTEMETKFASTRILMRPRPVGFGLHCNPNIHQVLKAAGIKDVSAKVWGSRNPTNVIKGLFRILHAGNAPLNMGDGIGGSGRTMEKGSGIRGKEDVERERGRKLVGLRTW